ncbi:MAG: hypothetical protein R3F34_19510 [Planctomycetota bacterium]
MATADLDEGRRPRHRRAVEQRSAPLIAGILLGNGDGTFVEFDTQC